MVDSSDPLGHGRIEAFLMPQGAGKASKRSRESRPWVLNVSDRAALNLRDRLILSV
jgi:hypothetical protein